MTMLKLLQILLACLSVSLMGSFSAASPPSIPAGPGHVMLKNGNVISGDFQPQGDRLMVRLAGYSRITIKPQDVLLYGESVRSIYEQQFERVGKWTLGNHWQMAEWCLTAGLLDEAGEHFQHLAPRVEQIPRLQQLENRLRLALLEDRVTRLAAGLQPAARSDTGSVADRGSRVEPSVRGVTTASATGTSPVRVAGAIRPEVSPQSIEWFRHDVHRLLVNRCGQSGCHGVHGETPFLLVPFGGPEGLNGFRRNLAATLKYVDFEAPEESRLLVMATTPHGRLDRPPLDLANPNERRLLERIRSWIEHSASDPDELRLPAGMVTDGSWGTPQPMTSAAASPLGEPPEPPPEIEISTGELDGLLQQILEAERRGGGDSKLSDPYDPEWFNRAFGPQANR